MLNIRPKPDERRKQTQAQADAAGGDEQLKQELSRLVASGEPRQINRALQEAKEAVDKATSADIQNITMIESGRCPVCHGRTETMLYTTVCPACGWTRRVVPDTGRCVVHLADGGTIACDRAFHAQGGILLCVTDRVVHAEVMLSAVSRVQYLWDEEELHEVKRRFKKQHQGVCAWCDSILPEETEDGTRYETYVAFGALQEHYLFCSEKCMESFKRQYPSRVHRNCYETDCNTCDKCVKQYDTLGFKKDTLQG